VTKDLLEQATVVGPAPESPEGEYWWISDQEVLSLRPGPNPRRFRLFRLDVASGIETLIQPFNRRHARRIIGDKWHVSTEGVPGYEVAYFSPTCAPSIDGKWFLWLSEHHTSWIAASLDGALTREWSDRYSIPSSCCWLRSGQEWVQLVRPFRTRDYVLSKAITRPVARRSKAKITNLQVADGIVLGVTGRDSILLYHPRHEPSTENAVSEVSLEPGQPVRRHLIHLPQPAELWNVALSKKGNRLAGFSLLRQPGFPVEEYVLWIKTLGRKKIHEVGRMHPRLVQAETGPAKYYSPGTLRWCPSGNEISFVFNEQLYRLPVS